MRKVGGGAVLTMNSSSSLSSYSYQYSYISSSKPQFVLNSNWSFPSWRCPFLAFLPQNRALPRRSPCSLLRTSVVPTGEVLEKSADSVSSSESSSGREMMPKIDKSGRFCSPRAAREHALLIIYAACLEGSDPVRLFEKRMNIRREPGYEFDQTLLMDYNHMSFGGPPVRAETVEEANELTGNDEEESAVEAEVLSAPPKLVYSKLMLRFTRKLLAAVVEKWNSHVLVIHKVSPSNWKNEPASRILELCILHLAMSEITVLETRHQIVINEAVDLAKRFCDGAAPRIINGCLRTFVKYHEKNKNGMARGLEAKQMMFNGPTPSNSQR